MSAGALVAQHLVNEPFLDRNMKATRVEEIEPGLTPAEPNGGGLELKGLVELMEKRVAFFFAEAPVLFAARRRPSAAAD